MYLQDLNSDLECNALSTGLQVQDQCSYSTLLRKAEFVIIFENGLFLNIL